jgi:hypothetical protein
MINFTFFYNFRFLSIFDVFGHFLIILARLRKVDGSWFFSSIFDFIGPKSELIEFIEKQPPQKALCLGPTPPPGESANLSIFIDFLCFLGLQYSRKNRHQNRHLQQTPPKKWSENWFFSKFIEFYHFRRFFNNSRPICSKSHFFRQTNCVVIN